MAAGSVTTQVQPYQDPRNKPKPTGSIGDEYKKQADEFITQLPQFNQSLRNSADEQARGQYQNAAEGIRSNANSRGLLYSGLKRGAEEDTKAALSGQLAGKYADINQMLDTQANSLDEERLQRVLGGYQGDVQSAIQSYQLDMARRGQQQGLMGSILGAGAAGGGAALGMAMSDERAKKNKAKADKEVDELLSVIDPQVYEYKNEKNGEGKHMSPMAQDLEKSEIGKSMVQDTPEGKIVDYGKGFGAIMAIQSALDKRLKKIEEAKS